MGADPNLQWEKLSVKIFSMDYIPKSLINMFIDSNVNFNIRSEYGSIFEVVSPLVLKHDIPNNKYNLCLFENTLQSRIDSPELIKGRRLNNISKIFINLYKDQCDKELKYVKPPIYDPDLKFKKDVWKNIVETEILINF